MSWMQDAQMEFEFTQEMIVDNFAGGGGASVGIEQAFGRPVDIAINHDPVALAMHAANHPETRHFCEDVFDVDPVAATCGRPVGLAWFSPDCRHHSKAKGGKPVDKRIRGLAWVVLRWAALVRPRIIVLENVEEFEEWGPLNEDNRPCPKNLKRTFQAFVGALSNGIAADHPDMAEIKETLGNKFPYDRLVEGLGYRVERRLLRGCDYGAPTIRRRLFLIARCDGAPIVWPKPTHGPRRKHPYPRACDHIDWSIPVKSIFGRQKPLAESTLTRIAKGIWRFVIDDPKPYRLPEARIIAEDGSDTGFAFLAKHFTGVTGQRIDQAASTITARDHHALVIARCREGRVPDQVSAFLLKYYGTATGQRADDPAHTLTTKARLGLVVVKRRHHAIIDIGMRMLEPHELFSLQGFPKDYRIDLEYEGKPLPKTAQIRLCGNSVCPPLARAIVEANAGVVRQRRAA